MFNAEAADSMLTALGGGEGGGGSRPAPMGGGTDQGGQVPEDLVRRAQEALARLERQIDELEGRQ